MEYRDKLYINEKWHTVFNENETDAPDLSCNQWEEVEIPHNWEDYQGYHCLSHGNLHGSAWYFKKLALPKGKNHWFIEFEGAGSYLSLWCNHQYIGGHKGGRTCYTAELTKALLEREDNLLQVKTSHPTNITDLPWVCGGCWGTPNTEGSQPLGIFRPVSLYSTGAVRIEPFGVAIQSEKQPEECIRITIDTQLRNLEAAEARMLLIQKIYGPDQKIVLTLEEELLLAPYECRTITQISPVQKDYVLWDLDTPALYEVHSEIINKANKKVQDTVKNTFGIRFLTWENFDDHTQEVLDNERLIQKPSAKNRYFVDIIKENKRERINILPGGVKIHIPEYAPEGTIIEIITEIENKDETVHEVELESFVQTYNRTKSIADLKTKLKLMPGEQKKVLQRTEKLQFLDKWSLETPYYHQIVSSLRVTEASLQEPSQARTPFGIFQTDNLANKAYPYLSPEEEGERRPHRFFLNGKPLFIQGTCEYEHLLGNDHAFSSEQIHSRMGQIQAAGFNSFREAHCPHNLRYLEYCERNGLLYWAQMGAHLYFDTPAFRQNFLTLTAEWVKERRNSPCLILWGIQNESLLPESFAAEVTNLIRSLDPSTSQQRKTTTCNGGSGSDWNIPQNWSGTYGGSVSSYGEDILRQKLVGEYGQYRVFGKHEEGDMELQQNSGGDVSEELFCYCLQTKIREIEKEKNYVTGHFQWIFASHANPGRETIYCLDGQDSNGIGVVNSKGLLTSWGEPVDCFYMYRSHYTSNKTGPMVYIVSHTWPDRFSTGPRTGDITVYSNCDEIELYNDYQGCLLGREKKGPCGEPFLFRNVMIKHGILYAVGYVNHRAVAEDTILLQGLPLTKKCNALYKNAENFTAASDGKYLYRVNCGGGSYTDVNNNLWAGDQKWTSRDFGYTSWAMDYDNVDDAFGSVRRTYDPISNSLDQELFQSYRYGRNKLSYHFRVEPGEYEAELYFIEPWYGIGGGMNCEKWRLFDVAVNGTIVLKNLDIWKEAGTCRVLKKTVKITVSGQELLLTFPSVKSYQAVISAIAIKTDPSMISGNHMKPS